MPLPYIDVNNPIPGGVDTINSLIGGYNSPEAAAADFSSNAPRAEDYIKKQYQTSTGDFFADPFQDAAKRRDSALMSTIQAGKTIGPSGTPISTVSTASGGNVGPSILGVLPNSPLIQGPTNQTQSMQSAAVPQQQQQQQQRPDFFDLAMNRNPLPDAGPTFLRAQRNRIAGLGNEANQLFSTLKSDNQSALIPKDYSKQELQLDATGKPVAGNVLNKDLYNDPRFQQLLKQQPDTAHKFYKAIYGRDLAQDITMQAAHEASVNKSDRDVLDQFKRSGDFDPITGSPFIRQMVNDLLNPGQQTEVKRPLSYFERQVLNKQGAFENQTGQTIPQGMNVDSTGATTPEEKTAVRNEIAKLHAANPSDTPETLLLKARKNLSSASAAATSTDTRPGYVKTADTLGQIALSGINFGGIDLINNGLQAANSLVYGLPRVMGASLPYASRIPHIPVPTNEALSRKYQESVTPSLGEVASEGVNYWDTKFPALRKF